MPTHSRIRAVSSSAIAATRALRTALTRLDAVVG